MNYEQFAIWLHGFLEISNAKEINKEQTQVIKDHLALLFDKKTPDRSKKKEDDSLEHLKKLAEECEERRPEDIDYQYKIICSDGTGSPPPELGTSVSDSNPCQEISLGKQFVGVDLNTKFDTALHKNKPYC